MRRLRDRAQGLRLMVFIVLTFTKLMCWTQGENFGRILG